jgi:hypothetical protein
MSFVGRQHFSTIRWAEVCKYSFSLNQTTIFWDRGSKLSKEHTLYSSSFRKVLNLLLIYYAGNPVVTWRLPEGDCALYFSCMIINNNRVDNYANPKGSQLLLCFPNKATKQPGIWYELGRAKFCIVDPLHCGWRVDYTTILPPILLLWVMSYDMWLPHPNMAAPCRGCGISAAIRITLPCSGLADHYWFIADKEWEYFGQLFSLNRRAYPLRCPT